MKEHNKNKKSSDSKKKEEKKMSKKNYNDIDGYLDILRGTGHWDQEGEATIPIVRVKVKDIRDVMVTVWDPYWDHFALDDNTPIIIKKRCNIILAGHYQLYKAKKAGGKKIQAVYIDSLRNISLRSIRKQFKSGKLAISFAYNLYASTATREDLISYSDFCNKIYSIFTNIDFNARIAERVDFLDYLIG